MQEINIRHYTQADRQAVLQIAADTAFFGKPVEAFLEDRSLFGDFFIGFYLTYKVEYCWVADNGDKVIGYLLGSDQNVVQSRNWKHYFMSSIVKPALSGRYKIGKQTASFAFGTLLGYLRGEEPPVDLNTYQAHLHINIQQDFRGGGLGERLMHAYLGQLKGSGVSGVYLHTTSHNEAACHLYEKLGFQILGSRPNRYWSKWFGYRIDNRSYGLKLS